MRTARRMWAKAVDGVQYAVVVNVLAVAVLAPSSLLVTGTLVALKWTLFLVGFLLSGAGALKLRPELPEDGNSRRCGVRDVAAKGGFGDRVGRLPPVVWYDPGPNDRLSAGGRLLLAGGVSLLVSAVLEFGFGVGVSTVG